MPCASDEPASGNDGARLAFARGPRSPDGRSLQSVQSLVRVGCDGVSGLLAEVRSDRGVHRQFVGAVAECHERAGEGLAVDGPADFDQQRRADTPCVQLVPGPRCAATSAASSIRLVVLVLRRRLETWTLTVLRLMNRSWAISA
jgi:hypothetical protein